MTTIKAVSDRLEAWRQEDNQRRLVDRKEDREAHDEIIRQVRKINGTQREHSVMIAEMRVEQTHHCEEITSFKSQIGTLFKRINRIDTAKAKSLGWVAGAMFVAYGVLEYLVHPLISGILKGGQ